MSTSNKDTLPLPLTLSFDTHYYVLVEFAVRHLDFQWAELHSVLDMHGITLLDVHGQNSISLLSKSHSNSIHQHTVKMVPLPNHNNNNNNTRRQRPFVVLELPITSPFVPVHAAENDNNHNNPNIASIILSRCTLVRSVMELWSMADSIQNCAQSTFAWLQQHSSVRQSILSQSSSSSSSLPPNNTWKLTIHTLGSKYTREEQMMMRDIWTTNPVWSEHIHGDIRLNQPDHEYVLIQEVELDEKGGAVYPRHDHTSQRKIIPENDARPPLAVYFGRALCGSRQFQRQIVIKQHLPPTKNKKEDDNVKNKNHPKETTTTTRIDEWSLKHRAYLGPTSMDAELSLVMTNLGQVQKSHVVFDPFVGTGSILLACALRGAHCIGTDIDIRVLRGKNKDQNVYANFRQFHLPRPELIRCDNNIHHRHFIVDRPPLYDAIVCDPPYGIRAGARKSGSKKANVAPVNEQERHDHIAMTQPYAVADVMADLLDVAARTLVLGGRLVYVIPSFATDFDMENDLPRHPCLDWVHICYQRYTQELGRRVVTMKKIREYDSSKRQQYMSAVWKNGPASADKCANIRDKILEAAKQKPGYEERLAIRKEKRRKHKEEKRQAKRQQQEYQNTAASTNLTDQAQNICK